MTIETSRHELGKKDQYLMTLAPNIKKLSNLKKQFIEVEEYCIYWADDGEDKDVKQILSIMTPEGEVYATNSQCFIETFKDIVGVFGSEGFTKVLVDVGTSKSGREFMVAVYAD